MLGPRRRGFGPRAAGAKVAFSEKCSTHHVFAPSRRSTGAQGAGALTTPGPVDPFRSSGHRSGLYLTAELILRPGWIDTFPRGPPGDSDASRDSAVALSVGNTPSPAQSSLICQPVSHNQTFPYTRQIIEIMYSQNSFDSRRGSPFPL